MYGLHLAFFGHFMYGVSWGFWVVIASALHAFSGDKNAEMQAIEAAFTFITSNRVVEVSGGLTNRLHSAQKAQHCHIVE